MPLPVPDARHRLRAAAPALFFFAGFFWDAFNLGRRVSARDFWQLGLYLCLVAGLLWWMGHRSPPQPDSPATTPWQTRRLWLLTHGPNLATQFLFGSLFSALFILYFKSSGHLGSLLLTTALGILLVGNEFLGRRYSVLHTLNWSFFGLTAMLLLNFILPHLAGSLHPAWFVIATLSGAGLAHLLRQHTPGRPGLILPVWTLAGALGLAFFANLIPPVPLVKRALLVGHDLLHAPGVYRITLEVAPWWAPWRERRPTVHAGQDGRVYCLSAVFAPRGLKTPLTHRWERQDELGEWHAAREARFMLAGGRENGFRGYSWINRPRPGLWRISLVAEGGRVLAEQTFEIAPGPPDPESSALRHL